MNVNPDPRPGRWLLPLVVLGMVMFTYVFVNQLPGDGATTTTTTGASSTSSTSIPDGSEPTDSTQPTVTTEPTGASPEVAAYLEAMGAFNTELTGLQADLAAANSAWEENSDFAAARDGFTEVRSAVVAWRDQVVAVSVPQGLGETHDVLVTAAEEAADQVAAALDGLVNAPGPDARVQAVAAFDQAVAAFAQALSQAGG